MTVKCGGREWKLHRCIICIESIYFEKALCGNFKVRIYEVKESGINDARVCKGI